MSPGSSGNKEESGTGKAGDTGAGNWLDASCIPGDRLRLQEVGRDRKGRNSSLPLSGTRLGPSLQASFQQEPPSSRPVIILSANTHGPYLCRVLWAGCLFNVRACLHTCECTWVGIHHGTCMCTRVLTVPSLISFYFIEAGPSCCPEASQTQGSSQPDCPRDLLSLLT